MAPATSGLEFWICLLILGWPSRRWSKPDSKIRAASLRTGGQLMFHNLIESSSHRQEIKRRGSFLLFTTATYAFLFAITGVVSIYAYDTHLEGANYEVVTMLPPVELAPPTPVA